MLSILEGFRRRCKWFNPANETTGDFFSTLLATVVLGKWGNQADRVFLYRFSVYMINLNLVDGYHAEWT